MPGRSRSPSGRKRRTRLKSPLTEAIGTESPFETQTRKFPMKFWKDNSTLPSQIFTLFPTALLPFGRWLFRRCQLSQTAHNSHAVNFIPVLVSFLFARFAPGQESSGFCAPTSAAIGGSLRRPPMVLAIQFGFHLGSSFTTSCISISLTCPKISFDILV